MQPVQPGAVRLYFAVSLCLAALVWAPATRSQSVVETPQQANDRIRALSASAPRTPDHDYVIGSGDTITVQVFEVPELSRDVRVSQTGSIGLPLVPTRVRVSGLTELQAEVKIGEILESTGLVSHPQISVTVKDRKSKPITIVGAVGHAMVYQVDHPVTLLEVLADAGGIANDAGDTVIITRAPNPVGDMDGEDAPALPIPSNPPALEPGETPPAATSGIFGPPAPAPQKMPDSANLTPETTGANSEAPPLLVNTITVNLNQLLETGNMANNIPLLAGDVITVPHAGIIYVLGAVARPGGFVVSNDRAQLSTLKVLSLAGGLSPTAKSNHAVIVRKDATGQQREIDVDLRKVLKFQAEDVRLQPSDILYVPKSLAKTAGARVAEIAVGVGTGFALYRVAP